MEQKLELEYLSLAEAAETLAGIAAELAGGVLKVEGTDLHVTGPVNLSVELHASQTGARCTIDLHCQRPATGSRLLREELARPGG